uniref:Putative secreted protein n=1 Tax=Ixodes ricinus TaxID=34613 RepID=A0A6B0U257_IXORI
MSIIFTWSALSKLAACLADLWGFRLVLAQATCSAFWQRTIAVVSERLGRLGKFGNRAARLLFKPSKRPS